MKKRIALGVLMMSLPVLAACGAALNASQPSISEEYLQVAPNVGAPMEAGRAAVGDAAQSGGFAGAPSAAPASAERLVIQNASLTIVVPDPSARVDAIAALAAELGGFVVSSNVYQSTFGEARILADQASVVIRVPADDLPEALRRIKEGASEVRNESISGQDVTAEYTDLESRLRNLEAAEASLREIMASATRTEDVMLVFNQLTQVRGEIEIIRGQMRYYEESTRFSAISVDVLPDVADQPLQIGSWRPEGTAKDALEDLVRALQDLGDLLIRFGICGVPFLLIFGLPAWLVIRAILRRRAKKATVKSAE